MDRRRVLLIVAVFVVLVGTALVFLYVRGADTRAASRYERVQVLQAVAKIEPGESVEDAAANGKLALKPVVRADVLPGALTSTEAVKDSVALAAIFPGEQIIPDKFGEVSDVDTSGLQIPQGKIALSVNLTDSARVSGFVEPGSIVAIFMSGTLQDGTPFSRLLLSPVTVLGVGSTTLTTTTTTTSEGEQTTEELPRTLLTVAVTPQEAQKVLFAESNGEVSFGLLTKGGGVKAGPPVTLQNLFR